MVATAFTRYMTPQTMGKLADVKPFITSEPGGFLYDPASAPARLLVDPQGNHLAILKKRSDAYPPTELSDNVFISDGRRQDGALTFLQLKRELIPTTLDEKRKEAFRSQYHYWGPLPDAPMDDAFFKHPDFPKELSTKINNGVPQKIIEGLQWSIKEGLPAPLKTNEAGNRNVFDTPEIGVMTLLHSDQEGVWNFLDKEGALIAGPFQKREQSEALSMLEASAFYAYKVPSPKPELSIKIDDDTYVVILRAPLVTELDYKLYGREGGRTLVYQLSNGRVTSFNDIKKVVPVYTERFGDREKDIADLMGIMNYVGIPATDEAIRWLMEGHRIRLFEIVYGKKDTVSMVVNQTTGEVLLGEKDLVEISQPIQNVAPRLVDLEGPEAQANLQLALNRWFK